MPRVCDDFYFLTGSVLMPGKMGFQFLTREGQTSVVMVVMAIAVVGEVRWSGVRCVEGLVARLRHPTRCQVVVFWIELYELDI